MSILKKITCVFLAAVLMSVGAWAESFDAGREIAVISREEGSGTRGAFVELTGVEEKNGEGVKIDNTTDEAVVTNSTAVAMTTVAGNEYAIGYISLGSLNDTVKALSVNGVPATAENVRNGSYAVARPFNIAYREENLSELAKDFIGYIMSSDGQTIISENGYVAVASDAAPYKPSNLAGALVVAGSSSVTPVMEKLAEAYCAAHPGASVEVQQSDSTTGITGAIDGVCDIGMASRALKDAEIESGVTGLTIATDGIAVIVNNLNPLTDISTEAIKAVYTGEATAWDEIA